MQRRQVTRDASPRDRRGYQVWGWSIVAAAMASGGAALGDDCNDDGIPDDFQIDDYVIDSGEANGGAFGYVDGADVVWLNTMTVLENAETIHAVSIMTGYLPQGTRFTVLVYRDPNGDGDPSDAELVASTVYRAGPPQFESFTRVPVGPVAVGNPGDVFFVGAYATQGVNENPAAMDTTTASLGASWMIGAAPGAMDVEDLDAPGQHLTHMGESFYPNSFMIRADASHPGNVPTECTLRGDVDQDGSVGVSDLLVLFAQWGACPDEPAPCQADLDGSGEVDAVDLLLLMSQWT